MSRSEFAGVMAYLGVGIGKPLGPESLAVYFDCLGDLSLETLQIAAKRVLMEHKWATFPSIAELRAAASETARAVVKELSAGEAWEMAWRAIGRIDLEIDGSLQRALSGLPPIVVEAMKEMGIPALVYGKEPVGVLRGQFVKFFEGIAARDQRTALLPAKVKQQIATTDRPKNLMAPLKAMEQLGAMPDGE